MNLRTFNLTFKLVPYDIDESNKNYIAPRQKGSLIIFDSRTKHRVCKVRSGVRKSIVGWVVGPRWK